MKWEKKKYVIWCYIISRMYECRLCVHACMEICIYVHT